MSKTWYWDAALFVMASPVYALICIARLVRGVRFVQMTGRHAIDCRTCERAILLVGFWTCGCGFTYQGHMLRFCPVCRTLPQVIRCEHCGATERVRR